MSAQGVSIQWGNGMARRRRVRNSKTPLPAGEVSQERWAWCWSLRCIHFIYFKARLSEQLPQSYLFKNWWNGSWNPHLWFYETFLLLTYFWTYTIDHQGGVVHPGDVACKPFLEQEQAPEGEDLTPWILMLFIFRFLAFSCHLLDSYFIPLRTLSFNIYLI